MNMPDFYVIGAAARATAAMAARAGFQVGCFDAYLDQDLLEDAAWTRRVGFRDGEPDLAPDEFRAIVGVTPWCYAGPLENGFRWIESASNGTSLWGNSAATCRAIRDFDRLGAFLRSTDSLVRMPETIPADRLPDDPSAWIFKPLSGSGGWDIRTARHLASASGGPASRMPPGVWQKFIRGRTFGATMASGPGGSVVLGLCESLRGAPGRRFAYRGSAGPVFGRSVGRILPHLAELAETLAREYGLVGLWNLDLVHHARSGRWYLLEINPRPSASMEVLELAIRQPIFEIPKRIFMGDPGWVETALAFRRSLVTCDRIIRKTVLYAACRRVRASQIHRQNLLDRAFGRNLSRWPRFWFWSDWPQPGTSVPGGGPLCSIYGARLRDEFAANSNG